MKAFNFSVYQNLGISPSMDAYGNVYICQADVDKIIIKYVELQNRVSDLEKELCNLNFIDKSRKDLYIKQGEENLKLAYELVSRNEEIELLKKRLHDTNIAFMEEYGRVPLAYKRCQEAKMQIKKESLLIKQENERLKAEIEELKARMS